MDVQVLAVEKATGSGLCKKEHPMDLNQKYADHQRAVMQASATTEMARAGHLETAAYIAGQIEGYQIKLGAAAACAWSVAKLDHRCHERIS